MWRLVLNRSYFLIIPKPMEQLNDFLSREPLRCLHPGRPSKNTLSLQHSSTVPPCMSSYRKWMDGCITQVPYNIYSPWFQRRHVWFGVYSILIEMNDIFHAVLMSASLRRCIQSDRRLKPRESRSVVLMGAQSVESSSVWSVESKLILGEFSFLI